MITVLAGLAHREGDQLKRPLILLWSLNSYINWFLSLSKGLLFSSTDGRFDRFSDRRIQITDRVKPQHPGDILFRGRHSRDLHNLSTELPAFLHSVPQHLIRQRPGEEMTRTDHRGAIFSASPPEPFADLLRSLDFQIQERCSGLDSGGEFHSR